MDVSFIKKISATTAPREVVLQNNPLSPLPLGDILCREGWLYEQLRLMSQGIIGRLPIYFRIPSWRKSCTCTIDDKEVWHHTQNGGWLRILREWKSGEAVTLVLGMELSLTKWSANGSVSVDMGSLSVDDSPWKPDDE